MKREANIKAYCDADDGSCDLLADALDGNASVIRPLILVILIYVVLMFVVLGYTAMNRDKAIEARESARFETLLSGHLKFTQDVLDVVAPMITTDFDIDPTPTRAGLNDDVSAILSNRRLANQIFLFSTSGELLSERNWMSDAPAVTAGAVKPAILTMSSISNYTGKSVSNAISVEGELFVLTVRTLDCAGEADGCTLASIEHLGASVEALLSRFWRVEGFGVSIDKPQDKTLSTAPARDISGQTIGWFYWTAWRPGRSLLETLLPWLSLVTAGVIAVSWHVWRRGLAISAALHARQEDARRQALHDPLTGLANRTLLNARLDEAARLLDRTQKGFALHLIDLDRFKTVNDTLGHQAGDELIKQAAARLKNVCRAGDTVARLGGDEFAIIQLDVATPNAAARLARRATEQLADVYNICDTEVFISGSVGVAIADNAFVRVEELMRQADIALYRAKSLGRNEFCFFEKEMDHALQERSAIEKDLRAALEREELAVVFQPQVSADGRHVRGLEALVRWTHAERGVVPPSVFVPVAEETGLIRTLGEFVMRRSLEVAKRWPDITMAVNVSAGELNHQDYAARVIDMIKRAGVSADQIELEITETVLLEDSARVTRTIKQLKAAGLRIALDDFGTGYSSLSYLRRHQVDKLKIDQSFVASIGVREDAGAVVQAIIHLGEALGLSVTAEGVETETQRAALRARGCAYLQGYLFSRPIAADKIGEMLQALNKQRNKRGAA